ncbi:cytochrome P450 [Talaromyces proteolyticus]|uniref:Cytochrome P450 n=1 Tax=Talaromyces proteolyticus TaxID=1131652 RepID=A0AAD4KD75_9EURO|nr:cytochrome P450 [Talaromyces proteolyticus]KAH8689331.1 cytochrome P450 [Talaromyces proteolyticus]
MLSVQILALGAVLLLFIRFLFISLRLAKIPGPLLAHFTDFWRYRGQNSPKWSAKLVALHQKHGKLVRIGPNHISVSDPNAVPIVYGTNPVWLKGPSYYGAATASQGRTVPSIIAMNEAQHSAVRKCTGRAFTTNSLLDYESSIDKSASELVEMLEKQQDLVDMSVWLQLYAIDVLMRIAFSESLGFVQTGDDVEGILEAIIARFDHWNAWAAAPWADYLFNKGPLAQCIRKKSDSPLARVGLAKLTARKALTDQKKDLLAKFLDGQAKDPDAISQDDMLGIIMSTIGAGADTTGGTLTYTLWYLCKHPVAAQKLNAELQDALNTGNMKSPPTWAQVNHLPFLDAVLKESMRCLPIAAWGLDRIVPQGGAVIAGQYIPAGTVVGCQIDSIHLDPEVYGKEPAAFWPERWLEASEDQRRRMDRAFLAFSAGKRTCTGRHIAWLELKKSLALLLINFEMELAYTDQDVVGSARISAVKYAPSIWMRLRKREPRDTQTA